MSLSLLYWRKQGSPHLNFGDSLAPVIVNAISGRSVPCNSANGTHLLSIGSILHFARDLDVVWGTGINGKFLDPRHYKFTALDIHALRGPLSRDYLAERLKIQSPEIFGDPGLLLPRLTSWQAPQRQGYDYLIIPHFSEKHLFPKSLYPNTVYPDEDPPAVIIYEILGAGLVISSSLHGLVIADAYGIPARLLRITENEPIFKYADYYRGSGRPDFTFATSVAEALEMGGEPPHACDLDALHNSFPRHSVRGSLSRRDLRII